MLRNWVAVCTTPLITTTTNINPATKGIRISVGTSLNALEIRASRGMSAKLEVCEIESISGTKRLMPIPSVNAPKMLIVMKTRKSFFSGPTNSQQVARNVRYCSSRMRTLASAKLVQEILKYVSDYSLETASY